MLSGALKLPPDIITLLSCIFILLPGTHLTVRHSHPAATRAHPTSRHSPYRQDFSGHCQACSPYGQEFPPMDRRAHLTDRGSQLSDTFLALDQVRLSRYWDCTCMVSVSVLSSLPSCEDNDVRSQLTPGRIGMNVVPVLALVTCFFYFILGGGEFIPVLCFVPKDSRVNTLTDLWSCPKVHLPTLSEAKFNTSHVDMWKRPKLCLNYILILKCWLLE